MSCALIDPNKFAELYDKFIRTEGTNGPVLVMFFNDLNENSIYFYMKFSDITWKTSINPDDYDRMIGLLNKGTGFMPIKIEKEYDD